jgi:leader peptidase (prepilin peptidase) / N-methyltransferase
LRRFAVLGCGNFQNNAGDGYSTSGWSVKNPVNSCISSSAIGIFLIALAASIAGFLALDLRDAVFGALLAGVVLFVAAVDVDRFEIPDLANLAIFLLGVAWTMDVSGYDVDVLFDALLRTGVAGGFLFAVRGVYRLLRHSEGLGLGDVKLAGAGAIWLSWSSITLALLVAAGAAIMLVVVESLLRGEKMRATTVIPFGAFLAPAIWVTWFAQVRWPPG